MSRVSVVRVGNGVPQAVGRAMELANWRDFIDPGCDVALKPNLGFDFFLPGTVTSPWVVEGVIQTIQGHVGHIYLVESGQVLVDVEKALRQTRMDRLCQRYGITWVNMSQGRFHKVELQDGLALQTVEVPEILQETTLITIPVMKTHGRTTITGAIKNQWGCLPELRHSYHLVVNEALVDLNRAARPAFAVMDATVGLEGNGPKSGRPRVADRVLASGDFVALDTIAARIMGFDPAEIVHIQLCAQHGLGTAALDRIQVVGEDIRQLNLDFSPGRNNSIAAAEILLRQSLFRRWVFDTPLFRVFTTGAKLWYYLWYYLGTGRRYRDEILYHTRYGSQWLDDSYGEQVTMLEETSSP